MIKSAFLIFFSVLTVCLSYSQDSNLKKYIQEGLENNLALKLRQDDYRQSLQNLREAKGLFFPEVSMNARFSVAEGGRTIEFPVGDLLNPVYSTLNQLTMNNMFQEIENQEFSFLRPREQETKIRVIQPIINPDIYYNRRIQENITYADKADIEVYKRALVADIKTAWYNHLKALKLQVILLNTKDLLIENVRVNQSLYDNDKITRDVVYRSEAELNKLEQQIAEAEKSVKTSAAYFNFLLNRELMLKLETEESDTLKLYSSREQAIEHALNVREELQILEAYNEAAVNTLNLNRAGHLPELVGVIDYGFEGINYSFTGDDDFAMASIVLRWELFKGFTNRSKISHARIGLEKIQKQKEEAKNAIQLQVINAWYNLLAAEKKVPAAESETRAAQQAFRLINTKYLHGQANFIEFMDSRNSMTNAETGLAIAKYDYLISFTDYEKAAGLYVFDE